MSITPVFLAVLLLTINSEATQRGARLPAALSRPLRTAAPAQAGRRRSRRHVVHLRERRADYRRRQGLGRRLDADHFGWEYKGKHKDLKAAYAQLLLYREALENPPLLVVCDMDRFEVHTNFTGIAKRVHAFSTCALLDFMERLAHVRVLDPACGSGNFLYVAIHMLLDLEKEVVTYASTRGLSLTTHEPLATVRPGDQSLRQQLAQVVIWIGYLQWMHYNGFKMPDHPVLTPIETVRQMDAILDLTDPEHPKEPQWPEAEFIVGTRRFWVEKLLRKNLGDEYVDAMFKLWGDVYCARKIFAAIGSSGARNQARKMPPGRLAGHTRHSRVRGTGKCWSESKRPAIFSSRRAIGNGYWTVLWSTYRWRASIAEKRRNDCSTAESFHRYTPTFAPQRTRREPKQLPRISIFPSWATQKASVSTYRTWRLWIFCDSQTLTDDPIRCYCSVHKWIGRDAAKSRYVDHRLHHRQSD